MAAPVARHEHDRLTGDRAETELVRCFSERGFDAAPFDMIEPVDLVEPAAADDADDGVGGHSFVMQVDFNHGGTEDAENEKALYIASSSRRRPGPMATMDPGLRRDGEWSWSESNLPSRCSPCRNFMPWPCQCSMLDQIL